MYSCGIIISLIKVLICLKKNYFYRKTHLRQRILYEYGFIRQLLFYTKDTNVRIRLNNAFVLNINRIKTFKNKLMVSGGSLNTFVIVFMVVFDVIYIVNYEKTQYYNNYCRKCSYLLNISVESKTR